MCVNILDLTLPYLSKPKLTYLPKCLTISLNFGVISKPTNWSIFTLWHFAGLIDQQIYLCNFPKKQWKLNILIFEHSTIKSDCQFAFLCQICFDHGSHLSKTSSSRGCNNLTGVEVAKGRGRAILTHPWCPNDDSNGEKPFKRKLTHQNFDWWHWPGTIYEWYSWQNRNDCIHTDIGTRTWLTIRNDLESVQR